MGKQWKQWQTIFLGSKITADGDSNHLIKRHFPWKESYDKPRQHIKKQRHHFADKVPYSLRCSFSSSLVWMWELDNKETWTLKNWCFWALVLEMNLKSTNLYLDDYNSMSTYIRVFLNLVPHKWNDTTNQKRDGIAALILDKSNFKMTKFCKDK